MSEASGAGFLNASVAWCTEQKDEIGNRVVASVVGSRHDKGLKMEVGTRHATEGGTIKQR